MSQPLAHHGRVPRGLRVLIALVLVACAALFIQSKARSHALHAGRALPLNYFEDSRMLRTDARGFYAMPLAVGDDYFDGTSSPERVRRHLQAARQVGARYLRCSFTWNAIEKAPGQYDWRFYDRLVDMARQDRIEILPYVAYTPEWAAVGKANFWQYPPRDPARYAEFMYQAVRHYRGRIRTWEVWNEPDNREYWQGSVEQFAALVKLATPRMRQADPAVVIVLGGMSHGPSEFFRSLLLDYDIGRWVDVVAMHGYPESWGEDRAETVYQDWISQMANLIRQSGIDLWANEMGYADYRYAPAAASIWGVSVVYNYEHTPEFAATSLFKDLTMTLASGSTSLAMWYRIDDFAGKDASFSKDAVNFHLGLFDAQGRPKPAFRAMKFFHQVLGEPVRPINPDPVLATGSQAVVDVFQRVDGHVIVAAWLRSSHASEVPDRSGMAVDARREQLSVRLPCSDSSSVHTFDEQGRNGAHGLYLTSGRLSDIPVRADHVFVADVDCK